MNKCYNCDAELKATNEVELNATNITVEHIIPNACGGRLKSKKLICRSCNTKFGNTFDKELAKQTNDLVTLLAIERENGDSQPITGIAKSTGDKYRIYSSGKTEIVHPKISKNGEGENRHLSITANDKHLKEILKEIKSKNPKIDIDAIIGSAVRLRFNEQIVFNLKVGGLEVFRAITKIAINYFIHTGGNREYIKHLLPYLNSNKELDIVWMHYPTEPIYYPNEKEVSHIIRLIGEPDEKILYAYIELFNTHNFIVKLHEEYDGNHFNETYAYDLLTKKVVEKTINFKLHSARII